MTTIDQKKQQLTTLDTKTLIGIHNGNVTSDKHVKKFRDRATAVRRTLDALIAAGHFEGVESLPIKAPKKIKSEKKSMATKVDERIIHLGPNTDYKFHNGSMRHECFKAIVDGMSVGEYLAATSGKYPNSQALGALNKMAINMTVAIEG